MNPRAENPAAFSELYNSTGFSRISSPLGPGSSASLATSGGGTPVGSALLLTNWSTGSTRSWRPRTRELGVPGVFFQVSQGPRRVPGGGATVHAVQTPHLARDGRRVAAGEEAISEAMARAVNSSTRLKSSLWLASIPWSRLHNFRCFGLML